MATDLKKKRWGKSGFTLTEVAMAIMIIGILMTMGIGVLRASMERISLEVTKTRLSHVQDVMVHYLRRNKRLPCPDVYTDDQNFDGLQDPGGGAACTNPIGILPYTDLGLERNEALDGWNHFFTYHVSTASGNNWTASPTLSENSTGEMVVNGNPGRVLVVVSHGPNGDGAFTVDGYQNVLPPVASVEAENTDNDPGYTDAIFTDTFDDILVSMTSAELLSPLLKDGTLKSNSALRNDDFETIKNTLLGSMLSTFSGPSCTFNYGFLPTTDPWGGTYVFQGAGVTTPIIHSTPDTAVILRITSDGDPGVATDTRTLQWTKQEALAQFALAGKTAPPCLNNGYEIIKTPLETIKNALIGELVGFTDPSCSFSATLAELGLSSDVTTDPWATPTVDLEYTPVTFETITPMDEIVVTVTNVTTKHTLTIKKSDLRGTFLSLVGGTLPGCLQEP